MIQELEAGEPRCQEGHALRSRKIHHLRISAIGRSVNQCGGYPLPAPRRNRSW